MLRAFLVLIACIAALPAWATKTLVRDEKKVTIQGVEETWQHLPAIGSAVNPNKALVLPIKAWQALLAGPGTHRVVAWPCGDHDSERHTDLTLAVVNEQITVEQRIYVGTKNDQRGALPSESNE